MLEKEDISTILPGLFTFMPWVFWEEVSGGDLEVGSDVTGQGPGLKYQDTWF